MSADNNQKHALTYEERWHLKNSKKTGRSAEDPPAVSLNSLLDMMSIVLMVMIFNVGADPLNVKESDDLRIPVTISPLRPEASMTITVTKRQVLVDDRVVITLDNGKVNESDLPGRDSRIVPEIQRVVEEALERQARINAQLGRDNPKTATMIVDGDSPFETVSRVMTSAQAAGLANLRFATKRMGPRSAYGNE